MKLRLSSVFDLEKYLESPAGRQLRSMMDFLSEFTQQVVQALTAQLTYEDNFLADFKTIQIKSGEELVIDAAKNRRVKEIRLRKLIDDTYYTMESFGWKYDVNGDIVVRGSVYNQPKGLTVNAQWTRSISAPWLITVTTGGHNLTSDTLIDVSNSNAPNSGTLEKIQRITYATPDTFTFTADEDPGSASGSLTYDSVTYFNAEIIIHY